MKRKICPRAPGCGAPTATIQGRRAQCDNGHSWWLAHEHGQIFPLRRYPDREGAWKVSERSRKLPSRTGERAGVPLGLSAGC